MPIAHASGLRAVDADDDEVLDLTLIQGMWTEEQYLKMTDSTSRLLESELGVFRRGEQAASRLFAGFEASVDAVFDTR